MRDPISVPLRPAPRSTVRGRAVGSLAIVILVVAACASPSPSATPTPSGRPSPTPTPTPTPAPTPRFTNEPDTELEGLIPDEVNGLVVVKPPLTEYGLTPGDIGQAAYGELGARFESLVIAFVRDPRLSLYAMRVDGPPVESADLEPYLATAGRYVGIAGLVREPWQLADVGGHEVWVRPSDNATLPGTHVYTWATDDLVFLMIGVSEDLNQAMVALLPGDPAPTPTPVPSTSPGASEAEAPSASPSGS
jgi:hypothetical protein